MAQSVEEPNLAEDPAFWMTTLPLCLRSIPIIHLAIPGSHDSTSYGIETTSSISPDARRPVQWLRCLGPLIRPILYKWSITQSPDIFEQLLAGVRYFDLRIAYKRDERQFYFVHNLYAGLVDPIFDDIEHFLNQHPSEAVILDFQHFFNMLPDNHRYFSYKLKVKFNMKLLAKPKDVSQVTLDYMDERRRQIILIYRWELEDEKTFWPADTYPTPWPNTVDSDHLVDFLNSGLKTRDSTIGLVSQFVLTPTVLYACCHLYGNLKDCCVLSIEKLKFDWLKEQKPGADGLNVVISDFVSLQNYQFCKEVINLNLKLLNDDDLKTL